MNNSVFKLVTNFLFLFVVAGAPGPVLQAKPDDKLAPADLVARHLESIGSAEARSGIQSVIA